MNLSEQEPTGESRNRPAGREVPRFGWRRTLRVALLAAGLALVVAGGTGFAAGRLLASGDGPVRCASWDIVRCIPGFDLDGALAALEARGFECERQPTTWDYYDSCRLARYWVSFDSRDGHVSDVSAGMSGQPGVSPTTYQEAFLSWVAVLPFADHSVPAEAVRGWLGEQFDGGVEGATNIAGYEYLLEFGEDVVVLEVDAGLGGWFR